MPQNETHTKVTPILLIDGRTSSNEANLAQTISSANQAIHPPVYGYCHTTRKNVFEARSCIITAFHLYFRLCLQTKVYCLYFYLHVQI
jgi:hypothetical protein